MIPDFPHNISMYLYKIGPIKKNFVAETANRAETEQCQEATKIIGPILFLYYEESLVSSNLNSSKLLRFHCAHPNTHIYFK